MDRQGVRKSLTDLQSVRKSTGVQTTVDITMVMDATGSMQNLMDNVKANALDLHAKIKAALKDYYDRRGIAYDPGLFPDCESCGHCDRCDS